MELVRPVVPGVDVQVLPKARHPPALNMAATALIFSGVSGSAGVLPNQARWKSSQVVQTEVPGPSALRAAVSGRVPPRPPPVTL